MDRNTPRFSEAYALLPTLSSTLFFIEGKLGAFVLWKCFKGALNPTPNGEGEEWKLTNFCPVTNTLCALLCSV